MSRRLRLLLWPAGAVFGLAAEYVQYGWDDPRHWIPDLAVGWVFIACGLVASDRRRESRSGLLMAATGFSWFIGNFAHVGVGPIDWVASLAAYLYLGPLYLLIGYPSGRLSSRLTSWSDGHRLRDRSPRSGATSRDDRPHCALVTVSASLSARSQPISAGASVGTVGCDRLQPRARGYAGIRLVLSPVAVSASFILAYRATLCVIAVGLLAGLLSLAGTIRGHRPRGRARRARSSRSATRRPALGDRPSKSATGFPTDTFVDPRVARLPFPVLGRAVRNKVERVASPWRSSSTTRRSWTIRPVGPSRLRPTSRPRARLQAECGWSGPQGVAQADPRAGAGERSGSQRAAPEQRGA
jgi:hypothetical protein